MAATDRLTRGLVKKKVKVKPKAKPVASKAKATASTASASQPALRQKGGSSAGESGETFALDGRTRIFKENLNKNLQEFSEKLLSAAVFKNIPEAGSKEQKTEERKVNKTLSQLVSQTAAQLKKVEARSPWRMNWRKQVIFWK